LKAIAKVVHLSLSDGKRERKEGGKNERVESVRGIEK